MRKLFAGLALAGAVALVSPASAAVIFRENFNGYRGTSVGQQPGTGLSVYTNGSVPGWAQSTGNGSLNAVDRGNGNYAIMFYDQNVMFYTPVAANELGRTYTVSFDTSIAASSNADQVTGPNSFAAFVLNDARGTVASYAFRPDLTTTAFLRQSFSYTGTGTGPLYLNILDGGADDNRYGSAVDDLTVSVEDAVAPVPEPATWAMMLVGFGVAGTALRRRGGGRTARLA